MNRFSDQADIMAIGDSLYQGVRSLTISPDLVRHSPPAQVAETGGFTMVLPDPPAEIVFDLEALVRRGELLDALRFLLPAVRRNLAHWPMDGQPWSQHEAFDNVAFGGATIASLTGETYEGNIDTARRLGQVLLSTDLPRPALLEAVGRLWNAISICFTLNPRHRREQMRLSALEQVAARAPRILLINIGSNEGLFRAGITGDFSDDTFASVANIPALIRPLAARLAALPARVEKIVFNAVLRPRFVPNLMPSQFDHSAPGDAYFEFYGARIGSHTTAVPGSEVKRFDAAVKLANEATRTCLRAALGQRLVWNDLFDIADSVDGKHRPGRGIAVSTPGGGRRMLVNKPVEPNVFDLQSGFSGLDNMHPTVPGYAIIADSVLNALGRQERVDKDRAFARDTLLADLPHSLLLAQVELSAIPLAGILSG